MSKLNKSLNGWNILPKANFVWLNGNPAFGSIPRGYVVHHLDHDKTNDDISNLVIMQKFHHVAHHFKQKTITPRIEMDLMAKGQFDTGENITKPKYYRRADRKNDWKIGWFETVNGKRRRRFISRYKGEKIRTEAEAQKVVEEIWTFFGNQ